MGGTFAVGPVPSYALHYSGWCPPRCFTLGGAQAELAESGQWQSVCWNSPITPVRGQTLREGALCPTLEQAYSRANGSLQSVGSFLQNILAAQEVCV